MASSSYVKRFEVNLQCSVCRTVYGPTSLQDAQQWLQQHDHSHFVHTTDESAKRQPDEDYVMWQRRTLSFARTYGGWNDDKSWSCGYCVLGRHEDCLVDCGCPDPACGPHSSGTTGAGIHDA